MSLSVRAEMEARYRQRSAVTGPYASVDVGDHVFTDVGLHLNENVQTHNHADKGFLGGE